jgi:hypothetical protein
MMRWVVVKRNFQLEGHKFWTLNYRFDSSFLEVVCDGVGGHEKEPTLS